MTRDRNSSRAAAVPANLARAALLFLALVPSAQRALAEDGYELWLRYRPIEGRWISQYRHALSQVVEVGDSATLKVARAELNLGLAGLLGGVPPIASRVTQDGAILIGTPQSSSLIARLHLDLHETQTEGYLIRSLDIDGHRVTVIAANADIGVLYGVFDFLRLLQTRQPLEHLDMRTAPRVQLRLLDHWDNLDGTVERGYAGTSLWDWQKLPAYVDPRYDFYARACASIGINGTVLNNVNASAVSLTPMYLRKAAALAGVFRPYGIRVYLSAIFSAPIVIGGLKTADPRDPAVRAWWQAKADEIYKIIPDFGGFLVKANSEGQPGPQDYGRSHAEGANMLAAALAPHGGIVMWRAFVYSGRQHEDRAKKAYEEFVPLDGQFHENVLLQVKYGPIDFQPREPYSPLFGAMPKTPLMLEVQITKEYLGFATHLAYLAPMWEETLGSDTYVNGPGSTVRQVIDGSMQGHGRTGIAGVANIGTDRNWTGSHFNQANWYAFGRLAWDPSLTSASIAEEWVRMTFCNDTAFVTPVVAMMMGSREAVVDYMTPLGLHHQMSLSHYGPAPWLAGGPDDDWTSAYFNQADAHGIGFERTVNGSNAVSQYAPQLAAQFASPAGTPEKYLLWFHHLSWDYRMASGRTLWEELVRHYTSGVRQVEMMRHTWTSVASFVDPQRYKQIAEFLGIQEQEAQWWRDASIAYFQSVSSLSLPEGYVPPLHSLQYYESLCLSLEGEFPTCAPP